MSEATGPQRRVIPPLAEPFPTIDRQVAMVMDGWSDDPSRVVQGLTTIINALSVRAGWPANMRDPRPWTVVPKGAEELAATSYDRRHVICTLAPMLDRRLTPDQRNAVLLGILLHEVGHVRGSEEYGTVLDNHARYSVKRNRAQWARRASVFSNILEDDRTEADTAATFPVYGQVIRLARWWLVSRHDPVVLRAPQYRDEVQGFACNVIRYREWVTLQTDRKTSGEAAWWTAWAARWTYTGPTERIGGMAEAIAHMMKSPERPEPDPTEPPEPPEPPDEPGEEPDDDEPGDEPPDEKPHQPKRPGRWDDEPDDTLPAHADDDLTSDERKEANGLGLAQVTSAGTRRLVTVRWQVPPLSPPASKMLTTDAAKASEDRHRAYRVAITGMGRRVDEGSIDVDMRVLDAARFTLAPGETPRVAASGIAAMQQAWRVYRQRHDNPILSNMGRKIVARKVHRLGAGDGRVFARGGNASPEILDVHLLIDRSGSMFGRKMKACHVMLATIAQALRAERNVRLTFWSESDNSPLSGSRDHGTVVRHWSSAEGYGVVGSRIGSIHAAGGFHDASAIETVARMIDREPGVLPVIAVLSDGEPLEPVGWVRQVVQRQRRRGVAIFGVGMGSGLTDDHIEMYGRQNLIQYSRDWAAIGHGIMRMLARLLP